MKKKKIGTTKKQQQKPAAQQNSNLMMVGKSVNVISKNTPQVQQKSSTLKAKASPQKQSQQAKIIQKKATQSSQQNKIKQKPLVKYQEQEQKPVQETKLDKEETKQSEENLVQHIQVNYSHYREKFEIYAGRLLKQNIDDEYAISFAFVGNFKLHLKYNKEYVQENENEFLNLKGDEIYELVIEEDQVAENLREKKVYKPPDNSENNKIKSNAEVDFLTNQLKNLSTDDLKNQTEEYKQLIEARDLQDILYN